MRHQLNKAFEEICSLHRFGAIKNPFLLYQAHTDAKQPTGMNRFTTLCINISNVSLPSYVVYAFLKSDGSNLTDVKSDAAYWRIIDIFSVKLATATGPKVIVLKKFEHCLLLKH